MKKYILLCLAATGLISVQAQIDTTTSFAKKNIDLIRALNLRPTMTDLKNYYNQTDSSSRPYTIANVPTTSFVSTVDGSVLQLVYSGTGNLRLKGVSYNSSVPGVNYSGYRARGTNTAPSSLLTNDIATVLSAYPYGSTAFPINSRASVALRMAENSTDANMGMYIDFLLTRQGTNTINASRSRFYYDSIHLDQISTTGVVRSTGGLLSSSPLVSGDIPNLSGIYAANTRVDSVATALNGKQAAGSYALNSRADSLMNALKAKADTGTVNGKANTGDSYTKSQSDIKYQLVGSYATTTQVGAKEDTAAHRADMLTKVDTAKTTHYYNRSGLISNMPVKVFADTFSIASAKPTLSFAAAGFTKVLSITATVESNTATVVNIPTAEINNYTTSSVTLNITQGVTLSILGSTVQLLQVFTGVKIHLTVIGY